MLRKPLRESAKSKRKWDARSLLLDSLMEELQLPFQTKELEYSPSAVVLSWWEAVHDGEPFLDGRWKPVTAACWTTLQRRTCCYPLWAGADRRSRRQHPRVSAKVYTRIRHVNGDK